MNIRGIIAAVALGGGMVAAAIGLLLMRSDDLDTFRAGTVLIVLGLAMLFGGVIYRMSGDDPESRWQLRPRRSEAPPPEA
ncbi:MAG: hypothetical protein E6G06_00410 [Actinobacteria bacterium]|jgi:hypothetical protein|nr:MAG: hypothetical protein E6G06_00410 [Actinomycetota bacterium]